MYMSECRSNVKQYGPLDHYQTAPDLGVHCLLRFISVPMIGVNTVSYLAASVTNYNNILIKVHCINPK